MPRVGPIPVVVLPLVAFSPVAGTVPPIPFTTFIVPLGGLETEFNDGSVKVY